MNSLSAHLTAGADHGRLRFHPDCPFCRSKRLAGTLRDTVLPAQAQAGLLAVALGASSVVPTSVAAASDARQPSAADVAQAPVPASVPQPAPAPDEPSTGVDETQEAPIDEAPDVRELLTSPDAGTDTYGEDIGGQDEDAEPAPPAPLGQPLVESAPVEPAPLEAVPTEPAPAMPAPVPQPPLAVVEPPPVADLDQPATRRSARQPTQRKARERPSERREAGRQPVIGSNPAPPQLSPMPAVQDASTPARATTVPVSQPTEPAEGPVRGASYKVEPGDSLWSIARRLLGGSPSAGQIAREVDRLWRLNAERIGTGNPSLIYPGTVLRLR